MNRGKLAGSEFTARQLKAIELLAGGMKHKEILKTLKCGHNTIYEWKKNPEFMAAVVNRSREMMKARLPEIYDTLADKAAGGDPRHIKILLDHMDRLEEMAEQYCGSGSITVKWKGSWDEDDQSTTDSTSQS